MFTLYRREPDGTDAVVAYAESQLEIGILMDDDRAKLDYEPQYWTQEDGKDDDTDGNDS